MGDQREVDLWFYAGVAVILAAVFMHPLLHRHRRRPEQAELLGTTESHNIID
jgi:hypothetical protein